MSRIFISHSSANEREAVAIKTWLATNVCDDVFLDVDAERGLVPGDRWRAALSQAVDRCEAVVLLISDAWVESRCCDREYALATSLGKKIIPVLLEDVPPSTACSPT